MPVRNAFVWGLGVFMHEKTLTLTPENWQDIRTSINHLPDRAGAFCLDCNDPVRVRALNSSYQEPHFAHFNNGGRFCPCGKDRGRNPDDIRAGIYGGNQESEVHRQMCNDVLECVSRDPRYEPQSGSVASYQRPSAGGRGRWPDVRFDLKGLGRFAVEVQLAPSLATEVVGRSEFYLREGIHLIWLVPRYSREMIRRAFTRDIAQESGGNLFVFDCDARDVSLARGTLALWVLWHGPEGYEEKLITLDDLELRKDRHPYFRDIATFEIFKLAERRRSDVVQGLYDEGGDPVSLLHPVSGKEDYHFDRLVRVLLTIWSAAQGQWVNFINDQPNLTAVLNAYLNSGNGKERAHAVMQMLERTRAGTQVKSTVWDKVRSALTYPQVGVDDAGVTEAMSLFPEVFRQEIRGEPLRTDILPIWAVP